MDCTICAFETSRRRGFSASRGSAGPAPCSAARKALARTRIGAPDADPRVPMALWGWPDTKSRLRWARRRFRMSLARFRLRHGQRSADADPRSLDVDGSDPPSRHASIGIGKDGDVHPHPPLRRGVTPSQRSFAGRPWSAASRRRTTARGNAKGRAARSSRRPLLSARFPVPCPGTVPRAPDDAPRLDGRAVVARMNRRRQSGTQPPSRRDISRGATPAGGGGGRVKARTPPPPNQAPVALGSLPSTARVASTPRPTARRGRKTLPRRPISGKAGVNRRSAIVCIDPPYLMHTPIRL